MTKGISSKVSKGGHGRSLSQKTLNLKKNPFSILEGVPEGGVQKKIADFTISSNNRKRPLSPEGNGNGRAKKPNNDVNPNLIPLGTRPPPSSKSNLIQSSSTAGDSSPTIPPSSESNLIESSGTAVETSPTIPNATKSVASSLNAHKPPASYASITGGAPAPSISNLQRNQTSGPHEASMNALSFDPTTVDVCDALSNCNDERFGHVFKSLVKFIERTTCLIDTQAGKIESLSSLVDKQADELCFLRTKLLDIEGGSKSGSDHDAFHRLKSERASIKEQFEEAQKIVRVVNIRKEGRPNREVISRTVESLRSVSGVIPSIEEADCFGNSTSDLCTITLKCRSKDDKLRLEKIGKRAGLDTRHHVPKNFVKTLKDVREAYVSNDFKGSIEKSDKCIMVRVNQTVSGFQVHMKSKKENGGWKPIEYLNFPTSKNCLKDLGGKQKLKSDLVSLDNVFIPNYF